MRFDKFLEHLHPAKISEDRIRISSTFCLGGAAFFLFITLGVTGLLLAIYYLPSAEGAKMGLHDLTYVIPFGWLIRSLHFWAGQLMLVVMLLHTMRVVAARALPTPTAGKLADRGGTLAHFRWSRFFRLRAALGLANFLGGSSNVPAS